MIQGMSEEIPYELDGRIIRISPLLTLCANCILPLVSNVVDIAQQEEVTTEALLSVPSTGRHWEH